MRKNLQRRGVLIALTLALGALSGAVWTRAQTQLGMTAVDGGSHVVDALLSSVTSPSQGAETVVVSRVGIRERCSDGDGCQIRLFLSETDGSTFAVRLEARLFSATAAPTTWIVFSYDGVQEAAGITDNGLSEVIVEARNNDRICTFRDDGVTGAYVLEAENLSPSALSDCVLRIDD